MEVGRADLRSRGVVMEMRIVEGTAGQSKSSWRVGSGACEHDRLCGF